MSEENKSSVAEPQSYEDAFNEFAEESSDELREEAQEGQEEGIREVGEESQETTSESERDILSELEIARKEVVDWQHRYNSDLGRQNALQRKIQELQQQNQLLQKKAVSSPAGMTDKEWKDLQEDFPEIAKAVESRLSSITNNYEEKIRTLESRVAPIQEQAERSYVSEQYRILEKEHPDYADIAKSEQFKSWVANQPDSVRALIESKQAADAAYLLRTYKNETMKTDKPHSELKQRREMQLRQAQTVPSRGGRARSNLPPDDDYEAAFDYFAVKR